MPDATAESLKDALHQELEERRRRVGGGETFDAILGRFSEIGVSSWSAGDIQTCLDADDLAVSFEAVLTTFVIGVRDDPIRFGVHLPEGIEVEEPEDAARVELYVIGECPRCEHETLLLPRLEDEFSAGLALEAGRAWEWHDCLPDGDDR